MKELENIGKTTKYMIHAVPQRMWYVEHYLMPEMIKNGIDKDSILIYNDDKGLGNLRAFLDSLKKSDCDLWHLQDDIIISDDFKVQTEKHNSGIVCGFCSRYSEDKPAGFVLPENMWYSFPCIRIPDSTAREFIRWIKQQEEENGKHKNWIDANRYDDSLFMAFLQERYPLKAVLNLKPNIVNHIDYLIGGSMVNPKRRQTATAIYWESEKLLKEWEAELRNGKYRQDGTE